jgi:hypothetical protein
VAVEHLIWEFRFRIYGSIGFMGLWGFMGFYAVLSDFMGFYGMPWDL